MKPSTLQFRLEGYRAIDKACIDLEGMTVLTGPGGSGKSTLLKYLYKLLTGVNRYKRWASTIPHFGMLELEDELYKLVSWVVPSANQKLMKDPWKRGDTLLTVQGWTKLLTRLKDVSLQWPEQTTEINRRMKFVDNRKRVGNLLEKMDLEVSPEEITFPELVTYMETYLQQLQEKSTEILSTRPVSYLYEEMKDALVSWIPGNEYFEIKEQGIPILAKDLSTVGTLKKINRVDYINKEVEFYIHSVANKPTPSRCNAIMERIKEIIQGDVYIKETINEETQTIDYEHIYKRTDGKEFPFDKCEASLKPFFYLYRLAINGVLNDKTLLIFDQPGVVLGSARIIQFACLACQIQKELKVKFLFATDLQEMTAALDAAAQGYGLGKRFKLYEAREVAEPFTYEYHQVI